MRKVIATTFISLDGVMQAPGGPEEDIEGGFALGGWSFYYWDAPMGEFMGAAMTAPFDLLLGRKTYDIFAAHWPNQKGDPLSEKFNAVTKYVATSSPQSLSWVNSVALRGDVAAAVAKLKQGDGPPLLLQGSSRLIQALLAGDLIDEFNLMIFPLVLGKGKKLFGAGTMPVGLKLTGSRTSTTGVVIASYERAGTIKTGSFATAEPEASYDPLRERMKRDG